MSFFFFSRMGVAVEEGASRVLTRTWSRSRRGGTEQGSRTAGPSSVTVCPGKPIITNWPGRKDHPPIAPAGAAPVMPRAFTQNAGDHAVTLSWPRRGAETRWRQPPVLCAALNNLSSAQWRAASQGGTSGWPHPKHPRLPRRLEKPGIPISSGDLPVS